MWKIDITLRDVVFYHVPFCRVVLCMWNGVVCVDGGVGRSSFSPRSSTLFFNLKSIYAQFFTKPNLFLSRFVCNL